MDKLRLQGYSRISKWTSVVALEVIQGKLNAMQIFVFCMGDRTYYLNSNDGKRVLKKLAKPVLRLLVSPTPARSVMCIFK